MRTALVVAMLGFTACAGPSASSRSEASEGTVRLRLPRLSGGDWDLGSERGNVVLVNYFATWCMPCVAEWPLLIEMQRRYGARGLRVVAVSMDTGADTDEVLYAFLDHFDETNFPVLRATDATFEGRPWPVAQLPTTVVVGRDGRPLGRWEGILPPRETEELLRSLVIDSAGR